MRVIPDYRTIIALCLVANVATGVDLDHNDMDDRDEQLLANKFAPCLVLEAADQGVASEPVEIMHVLSQDLWMRVFASESGQLLCEKTVPEGDSFDPTIAAVYPYLDCDKDYSDLTHVLDYVGRPPGAAYGSYKLAMHYEYAGQGNDVAAWRAAYADQAANNWHKDRIYAHLWADPDHSPQGL